MTPSDTSDAMDGAHSRYGRLVPATWMIFRASMAKRTDVVLVYPEHYLSASFEVFLFTMAVVWIVTAAANPDIIASNRIHDIFSYNNVCVGFDSPPARYVAQPLFALQSFFGVRYVILDAKRSNLEWEIATQALERTSSAAHSAKVGGLSANSSQYWFQQVMNFLFALTMLFWPMLLIVTPDQSGLSLNVHFYIYVIFVVVMYLTAFANFYETDRAIIQKHEWAWLIIFGVETFLLLVVGFVGFNGYDYALCPSDDVPRLKEEGLYEERCVQTPAVPVGLMATLDYGWFVLLSFTSAFLPYSPPLRVTATLATKVEVLGNMGEVVISPRIERRVAHSPA